MQFSSFHANAQSKYEPAPSTGKPSSTKVAVATEVPKNAKLVGVPVPADGNVPVELGLSREALKTAGFEGKIGHALVIPRSDGPTLVAYGIGAADDLDATRIRDAAAAFACAADAQADIVMRLDATPGVSADVAAQAAVEGVILARYRYLTHRKPREHDVPLSALTLVVPASSHAAAKKSAERGEILARATSLARDLANSPATLLTANRLGEIAKDLADECGLRVETFGGDALLELGCGGLLGVNAGSVDPPCMIKITYEPKANGKPAKRNGHIALVGKGIMYDSGGISLKPNDLVHATMKGDMSGAAAVLASMTTLAALGCKTAVTGYLMCTDNMPSGTAMKLGDVLTVRGGKTVEVMNTDAEGRLVMSDALVLATELDPKPDAIVDIATLTGACQRALGLLCAGVFGNHDGLVAQAEAAAARSGESVWRLPLERRYRKELDSEVADLKNVGGEDAGATTAALFLEEFVGDIPWAHIDIAGTARSESDDSWRPKGATGFGARLLTELITSFEPPRKSAGGRPS